MIDKYCPLNYKAPYNLFQENTFMYFQNDKQQQQADKTFQVTNDDL